MRKILTIITLFIASIMFFGNVSAASGSITATTSSKQVVVGSTFNVTVKVTCSEALGSWQFGISYDSSNISLQSGDTNVASYGDGSTKTKSYTYKFKAIKSGNAEVRITGASMVSWNDVSTLFTPSVKNTSVSVKTQKEIEASYSKNNNLKSLAVDGFEISPAFSKDTLEYTVDVPDDVTSINVSASVEDGTANVRGTGSIDVSEGNNKVEVVVTAQNGSIKTYTINVTVKDLTPINVSIDGENYSVVKKIELLPTPDGFIADIIKINDIEVPAYTSELINFTLVGLKDEMGEVNLYIYNKNTDEFKLYNEIKSASLTLYPVVATNIIEGFKKNIININNVDFEAFVSDELNDLVLVYAMNVMDGKTSYYMYDKSDNSFIKYNSKMYDSLNSKNNEFKLYLMAVTGISIILFFLCIILASKNSRLKKLILKVTEPVQETIIEDKSQMVRETLEQELVSDEEKHEEKTLEEKADIKYKKKKKKH